MLGKMYVLVVVALAALQGAAAADKSYFVGKEQRTFVSAWIACKTGGMELASIQSDAEQAAVVDAIANAEYTSQDGYWIGLVNDDYSSNGWYWIDSGRKMIYSNWGTYEPRFITYDQAYCVRFGNSYRINEPENWENVDCNKRLYYVCESGTAKKVLE